MRRVVVEAVCRFNEHEMSRFFFFGWNGKQSRIETKIQTAEAN